jgi:hypothetical protein
MGEASRIDTLVPARVWVLSDIQPIPSESGSHAQDAASCLVYKVLAAGRKCGSPAEVRQAFEFAYGNIKPVDAAVVGMYPRYSDQIGENTRLVREILKA